MIKDTQGVVMSRGWMVLTRSLQAAGAQTFVECEKNLKNSAREKFLIPKKKKKQPPASEAHLINAFFIFIKRLW